MSTPKFAVERPQPWLVNPLDGERHRRFFANLLLAITETGAGLQTADIPFGGDFAPRVAADGHILLSYHSVGAAPNVWRLKESYVRPYYTFDRTGYSGWAEITHDPQAAARVNAVDQAQADRFVEGLSERLVRDNASKYPQRGAQPALAPGYVFYPMQVIEDSVARLSRIGSLDLLRALLQESQRSGVRLVIKRHPLCTHVGVQELLVSAGEQGAELSDASVHTLIAGARAVVTVNSGVGFEALVHGKPVFTAGVADYDLVTHQLHGEDDVGRCFDATEWDAALVRRFVFHYLREYCVNGDDAGSIRQRVEHAVALYRQAPAAGVDEAGAFAHLAAVRYFAQSEALRRQAATAQVAAAPQVPSLDADAAHKQLLQLNANNFEILCSLYDRLAGKLRSLDQLYHLNRAGPQTARQAQSFSPDYYQALHLSDSGFQQNNWLLPYLELFRRTDIGSLREVGCGNGAFLAAAREFVPRVIGVDWARSPLLPQGPGIEFVQADITQAALEAVDINCSADVLEHLPFEKLPQALAALHASAGVNFHVVACYDDGHSHLSIFEPDEWLYLFRQHSPNYRLIDVVARHNDPRKLVCTITNWPQA